MITRRPRSTFMSYGCAIVLALTAVSCSPGPDPIPQTATLAPGETYGDWGAPVPTSAVAPVTVPSTTKVTPGQDDAETTETAPKALSLVDDDPDTEGYTRTTANGIKITAGKTTFDFNDGPEPAFEALGSRSGIYAGVTVPFDSTTTDTNGDTLDSVGWARSSGIFVVVLVTEERVASVRLLGAEGAVDETQPDAEGIAIAATRASSIDDITIEARDAEGNVIGTCAADDVFLTCN